MVAATASKAAWLIEMRTIGENVGPAAGGYKDWVDLARAGPPIRGMLSGKQEGGITTLDEQAAAIVKGFEQERDETLADSHELQRLVNLTAIEHRLLAHAAIRALRAAGYEIVRSKTTTAEAGSKRSI